MYKGPTDFNPQTISLYDLPIVVNHDAETLVSLTTITKRWDSVFVNEARGVQRYPSQALLYLFNADLNFNFTDSGVGGNINLPHAIARDRENGSAHMMYAELDNVIAERVYGNEHVYRAFLTGMNIYSVPEENPFKGLVNTFAEDVAVESGYPYLPPQTYIKERQYPLPVTVETVYLPHAHLAKVAAKLWNENHRLESYRAVRAAKAAAEK